MAFEIGRREGMLGALAAMLAPKKDLAKAPVDSPPELPPLTIRAGHVSTPVTLPPEPTLSAPLTETINALSKVVEASDKISTYFETPGNENILEGKIFSSDAEKHAYIGEKVRDYYSKNIDSLKEFYDSLEVFLKTETGRDELNRDMDKVLRYAKYRDGWLALHIEDDMDKFHQVSVDADIIGGEVSRRFQYFMEGFDAELEKFQVKYHLQSSEQLIKFAEDYSAFTDTKGKLGYTYDEEEEVETSKKLAEKVLYSQIEEQLKKLFGEISISDDDHTYDYKYELIRKEATCQIAEMAALKIFGRDYDESLMNDVVGEISDHHYTRNFNSDTGKRKVPAPDYFNYSAAQHANYTRRNYSTLPLEVLFQDIISDWPKEVDKNIRVPVPYHYLNEKERAIYLDKLLQKLEIKAQLSKRALWQLNRHLPDAYDKHPEQFHDFDKLLATIVKVGGRAVIMSALLEDKQPVDSASPQEVQAPDITIPLAASEPLRLENDTVIPPNPLATVEEAPEKLFTKIVGAPDKTWQEEAEKPASPGLPPR